MSAGEVMACGEEDDELRLSDEEGGIHIEGIYIPPPPKPYCSTESKGPRLVITHITNSFFKSYAESVVLGPFHKCFNAIIGPNGSGKSNVIDSMLFVFGYRATKIRLKKISELIHNSEQYPNVRSCEVTVHFAEIIDKDDEDFEIVPGSEFHITRVASKDNSSYYLLNGNRTQFKDIAVILRKHGIDLDHNRFLILQGEVEQISLMAPKSTDGGEPGMLEYLEDIIGTTRYKDSIAKLNQKVEILTDKRSEKLNRLKLVEQELNELKGPMEEAVQFLKLENEIIILKNCCYQKNIYDLKQSQDQLEVEKIPVQSMVEDVNSKIADVQARKKSKTENLKESSNKYEDLEKRKDGLKEAFEKASTKDVQLQADMVQVNKTRKKTKELLAQEEKQLENYKKSPEQAEVKIREMEEYEKTLQSKRQGFELEKVEALQTLKNQTNDLQKQREVLETELIGLNKIVNETNTVFTVAESELKIYTSNQTSENEKLENLKKTYQASEEGLIAKQGEVEKLKKFIPEKEKRLHSSSKNLDLIKLQETELVNNLRRKRAMLEESVSLMQASKSKGRVLDALMQQKREGKCPGLYGRLGDLGAIDLKYDVAVSTACGPLDNIVVDTVDTAEWCIDFLKKNDIGRATIIALEKQEHLRNHCNTRINTPENVPRLFDLIRVADDRVRPAFYYAIRDTLVADNLDQASRIAYGAKRYRVVTLNGDIIEMTGTMSGGGRQVSRGRMGQSVATTNFNPQEIEKAEHEVNNLEQKLRELRVKESSLAEEVAELNPEVKQMKFANEKFIIELRALQKQIPVIKQQLNQQEQKVKTLKVDPVHLKELEKKVMKSKEKYDKAFENAQVIQKQVNVITDEIQSKSKGQMRLVEKNLTENIKLIEKTKAEIAKMKVGIKTSERNAQKSKDKIATMQGDITDMENRLRKMKETRDEIEVDAKKLMECLEDIEEKLANIEELEGLKGEIDKLIKLEQHLKSEKIEVDEKMKQVTSKINAVTAKIHQWRVKITHLQLQDIPDITTEPLKDYTDEEIQQENQETLVRAIESKEEVFKSLKPNLKTIDEYREKMKVFIARSKELDEVSERRRKVRGHYDSLCNRRKQEFLTGYDIIKGKLKEMYQMITLGGDAAFELRDSFDPFSEGVQFKVRPPKKTWKEITNLSGGEKTLSSLALVFALHYYKPSPLYVMDEIDAALDFKNVSIVGNYIKERTKNAQFIIISLRSNMFELCDRLVGIYKTYNCTDSLTIDPGNFENNNRDDEDKSGKPRDPRTRPENTISQLAQPSGSQFSQPSCSQPILSPASLLQNDDVTMENGVSINHESMPTPAEPMECN